MRRSTSRSLFDDRPDGERVDPQDWHPAGAGSEWAQLDGMDTLGRRREWYRSLVAEGRVPGDEV